MAAKIYCLVPYHFTLEDLAAHRGGGNSHIHLSRTQAADFLSADTVDELRAPTRKTKGVLPLKRTVGLRGLSCRVGETLALAVADATSRDWALAMLRSIKLRREAGSSIAAEDGFSR